MKSQKDNSVPSERRADKWAFLKAWARGANDGSVLPEPPAPRRKLTAARADTLPV